MMTSFAPAAGDMDRNMPVQWLEPKLATRFNTAKYGYFIDDAVVNEGLGIPGSVQQSHPQSQFEFQCCNLLQLLNSTNKFRT